MNSKIHCRNHRAKGGSRNLHRHEQAIGLEAESYQTSDLASLPEKKQLGKTLTVLVSELFYSLSHNIFEKLLVIKNHFSVMRVEVVRKLVL